MNLAVTGGTGFVGRHLLHLLAQKDWQVNVLARDPSKVPAAKTFRIIEGDVSDRPALDQLCGNCDVVLHLAGAISGTAEHMMQVNGAGTTQVIAAAASAGARRFIHVSSLAAREPELSTYGSSKAAGEMAVRLAPRALQTLIIRPPAVYGEGDAATLPLLKMLTSRMALFPGTSEALFSLIHAEDLAGILVASVTSQIEGMREVDDGHGGYSWAEVAAVTRGIMGRPHRTYFVPKPLALAVGHAGDVVAKVSGKTGLVSADKMRQLYHADWTSKPPGWPRGNPISLAVGMRRTLLWSMENGLLPRRTPLDRSPAP